MQWTGCHGEERHGCNGQGAMVRRDMDAMDRVPW